MPYTFRQLKKKNVSQLREIAARVDNESIQGYTQMNKEHLLNTLCGAFGIDTYEHHRARGINKTEIKQEIRALKQERDQANSRRDKDAADRARKRIKILKRMLRKAMV